MVRLDGLVSVVDAENFERTLKEHKTLAKAQLTAADLIVLNKCDLVSAETRDAVEEQIRALSMHARVMRAIEGQIPLESLLGIDSELAFEEHDHVEHEAIVHPFETWVFREQKPLRWKELAPVLANLPTGIFRAKGFLNLVERPGDKLLLHVVGGRVHVRTISPWPKGQERTEIVFIGTTGTIDRSALEAQLRATSESPQTFG
jgi:G3E family GTPase